MRENRNSEEKHLGADAAAVAGAGSIDTDAAPHAAPGRPQQWSKEVRYAAALKIADELRSERAEDFSHNTREELAADLSDVIGRRWLQNVSRS